MAFLGKLIKLSSPTKGGGKVKEGLGIHFWGKIPIDLLTFGYLMLDDALGYPYYRLFNVRPTTNNQQPHSHIAT